MDLRHIPIDKLKISTLNMRHERKKPEIGDILPSIRERGVLVPLIVRPNGAKGSFEILAGRRRFFASTAVLKESGEKTIKLPCAVLAEGDDAGAIEASILENVARLEPDEMSQFEAFHRLAGEGRTVEQIATTFGVTELMVRRRLALADLIPEIRKAYAAEEIDGNTITALTLASEAQQREWFDLWNDDDAEYVPTGRQLKAWLLGGEHISTDKALFDLDNYHGYAGQILTDLFGEESVFADAATFWKCQNEALAKKVEDLRSEGWADVIVLDKGRYFAKWDHVARTKKDGGKVYVEVRDSGEITFHEGFVTTKDAARSNKAKITSGDDTETTTSRPEMTQPLQTYFELHRHAAVRAKLFQHPDVAMRLMVAHSIVGSGLWQVRPEPQRSRHEATLESVGGSASQTAFGAERKIVLGLLGLDASDARPIIRGNGDGIALCDIFARLLKLSEIDVLTVLTYVMAESLEVGNASVEALGNILPVSLGECWTPDAAFFDLLRDKQTVNAMLREIAGKSIADSNISETVKIQKGIIVDALTGANGREATPDWRPRWATFPFGTYRSGDGIRSAAVWKKVSRFFSGNSRSA
jgi:ParB family chromosome partitioning protein